MMKKELQRKFEEMHDAIVQLDTNEDVFGLTWDDTSKLLEVHVRDGQFPAHYDFHNEYVWRGSGTFPWKKQVILNGVKYYTVISQEQFDQEQRELEQEDEKC